MYVYFRMYFEVFGNEQQSDFDTPPQTWFVIGGQVARGTKQT